MKLIPDWKSAWRFASVRLAMVAVAWGVMAPETQAAVLDFLGVPAHRVPAALGVLFVVFRVLSLAPTPPEGGEK